jgi:hypothetical protein
MYVYCILGIMIYAPTFVCSWVMKFKTEGSFTSTTPDSPLLYLLFLHPSHVSSELSMSGRRPQGVCGPFLWALSMRIRSQRIDSSMGAPGRRLLSAFIQQVTISYGKRSSQRVPRLYDYKCLSKQVALSSRRA